MKGEDIIKELDSIQTDIWARINEELQKRGVKYTIGDAYCAGSEIKYVLHPRVKKLLASQKQEILEETGKRKKVLNELILKFDLDVDKHRLNEIKQFEDFLTIKR